MHRRDFAKLAGAAALAPRTLLVDRVTRDPAAVHSSAWPGYERAVAIDCLASPGPFNTPDATANALTPEMVANARASGITAVNLTVSSAPNVAATFRDMGYWERELQAHPDVLMKIYSVADLRRAKETRRLGLICGFQNASMLEGDASTLDVFQRFGVRII